MTLSLEAVGVSLGGREILRDVSCRAAPGEVVGRTPGRLRGGARRRPSRGAVAPPRESPLDPPVDAALRHREHWLPESAQNTGHHKILWSSA